MAPSGRAVPLSLPLDSPSLRVLKSLRGHHSQLQARLEALAKLQAQLEGIPDELRWDALVPVPGTSSLAYGKGQIVNTNTVTVNLGGGEGEEGDSGYWVEYSAKQARGVAARKREDIQAKLAKVQSAITDTEATLSTEMGFDGGSVNDKYEVLNEEGLPFVEIQEFEDDEGVPEAVPGPSSSTYTSPQNTFATTLADTTADRPALQMPPIQSNTIETFQEGTNAAQKTVDSKASASSISATAKGKTVSFSAETKPGPSEEEELPVIGSQEAVSATQSASKLGKTSSAPVPLKNQVMEKPMKGSIIEKDTTKPPPVLTAAERATKPKSRLAEAQDFDGVEGQRVEKVDLSAYLPRGLRGAGVAKRGKGKERADEDDDTPLERDKGAPEAEDEDQEDEDDDDDDSDGLYQYDHSEDEDDDNLHIDDVMAMREAALEYHARRYDLGAGAGTGALGGYGKPDDFDEVGGLSTADKAGLPFVETYETTDGLRPPSKFRTGRLQTARMVIPDLPPNAVDISKNVLPGDQLGPFEDSGADGLGPDATNDFQGMSKEEIATFLRYVKALETGEELGDLHVVPAQRENEIPPQDKGPMPPMVRETVVPSVKSAIVEKSQVAAQSVAGNSPEAGSKQAAGPPKRVSRFRAARGD